jgi:hypothetical protein
MWLEEMKEQTHGHIVKTLIGNKTDLGKIVGHKNKLYLRFSKGSKL